MTKSDRHGVATIEAAGMIGIIITMVLFGYAVGVQSYHASTAADIIERVVNDNQVRPFRLVEEYSSGPDALVVDAAALNQFIAATSGAVLTELVSTIGGSLLNAGSIGVEAGYMVLSINQQTGAITGVQTYQIQNSGGLSIPQAQGALAALQGVANSTAVPADFAVMAGTAYGGGRFLSSAVVAAVAIQIKEESVERKILNLIGLSSDLYQRKIVSLRGDVS